MGLNKISAVVEHRLSAIFAELGWQLAATPFRFILALIVLAGILAGGIPLIKSETEAENLYAPSSSNRGRQDLQTYTDMFSAVEGEQAPNYFIAYAKEGVADANLFTPAVLNDLYDIHQKIKALKATEGDKSVTLADLCTLSSQNGFEQECEFQGVTDLMTGPIQATSELLLDPKMTQDLQGAFQVTPLFAGGRSVSADGTSVTAVKAWRWSIILDTGRLAEEDVALQEMWMRLMLDTLLEESEKLTDASPYRLAVEVEFSNQEELDKATDGDTFLLTLTFTFVITFSFLIVRSYTDSVLSKGIVVNGAVAAIILALACTFGFMGYCGVIFNPVVSTSALLLLGLGVDDAYVIIQAWHSSAAELEPEATVQERMRKVFETAGVSVFFTSITDIIAFAVGCTSTFPAIRGFCAYTATGVFFVFVYQLLFFGAVMAIDGHREYCGKSEWKAYLGYGWLRQDKYSPTKDLTARVAPGGAIPVMPEVAAIQKVVGKYGRMLLTPWCSASVLALFAGYLAYAIVGVVGVGTGLDFRDLAATDSYWTVFVNQRFEHFNEKGPVYNVAFPGGSVDWSIKAERDQVLGLLQGLESLDCITQEDRTSWLRELYSTGGAAVQSAEGDAFYTELRHWLNGPGFEFRRDVLLAQTAAGWDITAARMNVRMVPWETTGGDKPGVPCMQDTRKVLDAWQEGRTELSPLISFEAFQFWEGSAVIVEQTMLNLVYAAAGCGFMTLLILPHPVMVSLAMLTVAMILAGTVGTMSLILDLRIETVSMINLVLAIGFSIDNVAHYCHAYMASKKRTRKDKALDALEHIGIPILAGDASTMIALLPLLASKSLIFRSFFYILFTVLLLGALHAVVFLPIVLAWLGPLPDHEDSPVVQSKHQCAHDDSGPSPLPSDASLKKEMARGARIPSCEGSVPSESAIPDNVAPQMHSPVVLLPHQPQFPLQPTGQLPLQPTGQLQPWGMVSQPQQMAQVVIVQQER